MSDKPVCLVLSCNRPYYKERRRNNKNTFKLLEEAGFNIVFLFADCNLDNAKDGVDEDLGYNTLTVPCPDSYDYLSRKIELAFAKFNYKHGILKIDDDIRIRDPSCLTDLQKIITETDYFGIAEVNIKKNTSNPVISGKKFSPIFNNLIAHFRKDFIYFGGPFYWVSKNTLQKITTDHLEYPWEDLAVGYLVSKYPELIVKFTPWYEEKKIMWDGATETLTGISNGEEFKHYPYCGISVQGRLGNHMFQIAALIRHCLIYEKDINIYVNNNHDYYNGSLYRCKQFITKTPIQNNAHVAPFHYVPIKEDVSVLDGYFQSSRYFSDLSGSIRELFEPHTVIKNVTAAKYGTYLTKEAKANTVIVHVRRGDYMTASNLHYHGILTPLYYRAAMKHYLDTLGPSTQFLLFSDDIEYCRATYGGDPGVTCIDEQNEGVALHFMSQFRHYIIANSSFSWWATYLGEPAVNVVAPDRWFGPAGPQDWEDIYEPGWLRLKAE
jgi:hypothetical protein